MDISFLTKNGISFVVRGFEIEKTNCRSQIIVAPPPSSLAKMVTRIIVGWPVITLAWTFDLEWKAAARREGPPRRLWRGGLRLHERADLRPGGGTGLEGVDVRG